jgi:hypothetical protein
MDADKLVAVYIKMRDKKKEIKKTMEAQIEDIESKMALVSEQLMLLIKENNAAGLKTEHGTVSRIVQRRFWVADWDAFAEFIDKHGSIDLLERRISQNNFAAFLEENPELTPPVNADSKYVLRVTPTRK